MTLNLKDFPVRTVVPRRAVRLDTGPGLTKQAPKDECDINFILARYQKTGALEHLNKYEAQYGDAPAVDFREALELVREAQSMFDALPSSLRERFANNPENFLAFVQDRNNTAEAITLGLATAPQEPIPAPTPPPTPGKP